VTFLDSPGHKKYQKTTLGGLTGDASDYALLILNANYGGLAEVAKEQIMLTKMLQVPIMICLTKIDIATKAQLTRTVQELMILLKSPGICVLPSVIQNEDDIAATIPLFVNGLTVPLFLISNVTGENINLLKKFFNLLPKPSVLSKQVVDGEMEFQIQDMFNVHGCGTVVGGLVKSGEIYLSGVFNPLICYIGPDHGRYTPVLVSSIHRQRFPVKKLSTAQVGTLGLKFPVGEALQIWEKTGKLDGSDDNLWVSDPPSDFRIRRGQSICSFDSKPVAYREIEVDLSVLSHPTELRIGQEIVIYSGSVNQPAKIIDINNERDLIKAKSPKEPPLSLGDVKSSLLSPSEKSKKRIKLQNTTKLKQGESGNVTFRFSNEPEHLSLEAAVIIKGEKIKCVAKITRLLSPASPSLRKIKVLLS
jgi:GTPase